MNFIYFFRFVFLHFRVSKTLVQRAGKEEERSQVHLPRATENAEHDYRCTFILQKNSSSFGSKIISLLLHCLKNYSVTFLHKIGPFQNVTARTNIIFISDIPLYFYGVINWHVIAVGRSVYEYY